MAAKQTEAEGCFELSIGNPDKGLLPLDEVRQRVEQFTAANLPLVVVQVRPMQTVSQPLTRCIIAGSSAAAWYQLAYQWGLMSSTVDT